MNCLYCDIECKSENKINPVCNDCNLKLQGTKKTIEIDASKVNNEVLNSNTNHATIEKDLENIKMIFSLALILFWLWLLFGGIFVEYKTPTIHIDCDKMPNSKYCNGDFDLEIQNQDAFSDQEYWRSIGR